MSESGAIESARGRPGGGSTIPARRFRFADAAGRRARRAAISRWWRRAGAGALAAAAGTGNAAAASWDRTLAEWFSGRWEEIGVEQRETAAKLAGLPGIPVDDQGGTGGMAVLLGETDAEHEITLRWDTPAAVGRVVLVPARRYTVEGLEPQFGLPDAFEVELLGESGEVLETIGGERGTWSHPVRAGHPFSYPVATGDRAAGVRIRATRLAADSERTDGLVHAWAEVFVFADGRNIARGAAVTSAGGASPAAPWHWDPSFLVDEQTPLGLPELPAADHRDIGWLSAGRQRADETVALTLDLGKPRDFDAIRLLPAKRPTADLPSGFGFPRHLRVRASERPPRAGRDDEIAAELVTRNPGHNPVRLAVDRRRARFLRLEAVELWKEFDGFPAFFALSEIEVLDRGKNVARGAAVRSAHGMGNIVATGAQYWNTASLTDGFGPDGRLVPTAAWLAQLDRRLKLETRLFELAVERRKTVARWRRVGISGVAVLGAAGAFGLIALPIRYRIRSRRELKQVRERIAGDLHDEVGSNLGSIQMLADLAEGRTGGSDELNRIQRIAAETVSAVRDIVWLLRPRGGHRIGTIEHLRETASIMLERHEWEFTADEEAWEVELSDEASRELFLFFREALHNILRHAGARRVTLRAERCDGKFVLELRDDGAGIPEAKRGRPSTLRALRQRADALGAKLEVESAEGRGTELTLTVPLE